MREISILQECHDVAQAKRSIAKKKAAQKVARINDERELNILLSKTRSELKKLSEKYLEKNTEEQAILNRLKELKNKDFLQLKLL